MGFRVQGLGSKASQGFERAHRVSVGFRVVELRVVRGLFGGCSGVVRASKRLGMYDLRAP